jgi:pilus assembly protein CpaC
MKRLMRPIKHPARLLAVLASAGLTALAPIAASARPAASGASEADGRSSVQVGSTPRLNNPPRGSARAIDLPTDAHDAIVSNPAVAEALTHSSRRYTIIGVAPGQTDAVFLDAAGRTILSLRIRVDAGVYALQDSIDRIAPGSQAHAEALNDSIVLTGMVTSPAEADRVVQLARAFVSAPEKVLNMMTVAGSDQVTLKVRVVEVQRSAAKQLGLSSNVIFNSGSQAVSFGRTNTYGANGASLGGGGACYTQNGARTTNFSNSTSNNGQASNTTTDTTTTIAGPTVTETVVGNSLTNAVAAAASSIYSTVTGNNASACLQAFERVGLIRTLAEPNLTSVNGESATFLAGGEFPVPSGRDKDGTITVEYKPYGVSLAFRPVVRSAGNISMQVSVEVSELANDGGLTIGAGTTSSISLPGLKVRRSQTTVELPSGGSMMIAGMLQENTAQTIDSLPGVTNLPVLGSLFRSRDYMNGETELVVIVEPYIVSPTSPGQMQTPADGLRIATDLQSNLFGQLNQAYGTPAPTAANGAGWQGPVGYVIE